MNHEQPRDELATPARAFGEQLCGGTRKTIMNTTNDEATLAPTAGSLSWSSNYKRGYQAGYVAGMRHRKKADGRAFRESRALPIHDLSDPIRMKGYKAVMAENTTNPYRKDSREYYLFNQGCWVAWGMATTPKQPDAGIPASPENFAYESTHTPPDTPR